jgi:hypothetical protein
MPARSDGTPGKCFGEPAVAGGRPSSVICSRLFVVVSFMRPSALRTGELTIVIHLMTTKRVVAIQTAAICRNVVNPFPVRSVPSNNQGDEEASQQEWPPMICDENKNGDRENDGNSPYKKHPVREHPPLFVGTIGRDGKESIVRCALHWIVLTCDAVGFASLNTTLHYPLRALRVLRGKLLRARQFAIANAVRAVGVVT